MSDQITLAFIDLLRAACARRPVLLVLEDLHWGDVLTVKLIDAALRELSDLPWMVLAFARPEVHELFPKLWPERLQEIRLGGLSRKASERLVEQVLGRDVGPATVARIVERSAGNALYLEELIRAAADGKGDAAPETVLAMVQARLHRLDPTARRLLRAASVFGDTFWSGGVLALAGDATEPGLASLVDAEVIQRRRESRFAGELEYGFRHSLVRDAAYSLLTESDRELGHRLAGAWLEESGERDPMVVAEHHRLGGRPERAVPFYVRAADRVLAGNDLASALARAERGIACGAGGEVLGVLRGIQCSAYFWRDEWAKGYEVAREALALLPRGGLRWCKAIAHQFIFTSIGLQKHAEFGELVALFPTVAPTDEARAAYLEAAVWVVTMFTTLGQRAPGSAFLVLVDHVGAGIAENDPIARAWSAQAHMFHQRMLGSDPWQTLACAARSSDSFHLAGDRRNYAFMNGYRGMALGDLGQLAGGERALRDSLALADRLGEVLMSTNSQLYLALLLSRTPERCPEAFALATELRGRNPLADGVAGGIRAQAMFVRADLADAEAEARAAYAMLAATAPLRFHPLAVLLRVLVAQGRAGEARALAGEGLAAQAQLGGGYDEIAFRVAAAEARRAAGDDDGARAALRDALDGIERRAGAIPDAAARATFLAAAPENMRAKQLASAWGVPAGRSR